MGPKTPWRRRGWSFQFLGVVFFRNQEIERLQEIVARELGYKLVDHRLELYGVAIDAKDDA